MYCETTQSWSCKTATVASQKRYSMSADILNEIRGLSCTSYEQGAGGGNMSGRPYLDNE